MGPGSYTGGSSYHEGSGTPRRGNGVRRARTRGDTGENRIGGTVTSVGARLLCRGRACRPRLREEEDGRADQGRPRAWSWPRSTSESITLAEVDRAVQQLYRPGAPAGRQPERAGGFTAGEGDRRPHLAAAALSRGDEGGMVPTDAGGGSTSSRGSGSSASPARTPFFVALKGLGLTKEQFVARVADEPGHQQVPGRRRSRRRSR